MLSIIGNFLLKKAKQFKKKNKMDDVNMSSLICEEDIIKELEQFNVKFEDKEVITKCKL